MIPIPKVPSPHSFGDFRPIALLPIFSKIFEKILEVKMRKFLDKNNILNPAQYGFKTNTSTDLASTSLYDSILNNLDHRKITCSIFLDLRKAFDSVNHDILLKKLEHYGFRGLIWRLLNSYLKGRKICTKVNNNISKFYDVELGAPQGSVLGPLFFLLYVNDLPLASNFETTRFADDTNLYISHPNLKTLQNLVSLEITKIENWVCQNKLTINYNKSAYMLISNNKSNTPIDFKLSLNHNVINRTNSLKYLGVTLNNKLS